MTAWYCTWCGKAHAPDSAPQAALTGQYPPGHYSQPDPRYAVGLCGKTRTVLVTDEAVAQESAHLRGRYRPKPLAGPMKADELERKAGLR